MNESDEDTILAVSTASGRSLRGVVRLSGPHAVDCARRRFQPEDGTEFWSHTFRVASGHVLVTDARLPVPAMAYVMRAPHSYTCEDVVELHVPGSPALLDMILDDLSEDGPEAPRLAQAGEFTRRAFMNGRIDLSQAEAVLAVIRARSAVELRAAMSRLGGGASRRCSQLQERLTELRVRLEAALDFAEHGIELVRQDEVLAQCRELRASMAREIGAGLDDLATDGTVHAVIAGPPNAGKSSLLNRLTGTERALVYDRSGTTRDPVQAEIEVDGIAFRLTDTAGLTAETGVGPDAEAARRSVAYIGHCQLLVLVLDGSEPLAARALGTQGGLAGASTICVINKSDLPQRLDLGASAAVAGAARIVRTSALTGEGLDELRAALARVVVEGRLDASAADCLFNARQRGAVRKAAAHTAGAERAVRAGMGYEFAAFDLRCASDALGEVTGEVGPQDVLDRVFSRFCIGK